MHGRTLIKVIAAAASATALTGAGVAGAQVDPSPGFTPVPITPCVLAAQLNPAANVVPGATAGNDLLFGTSGPDIIDGLDGNDVLLGFGTTTSSAAAPGRTSSPPPRATTRCTPATATTASWRPWPATTRSTATPVTT